MAVGLAQYLLLRRSTIGDAGKEVVKPLDGKGLQR
jgi:hypothetical protein